MSIIFVFVSCFVPDSNCHPSKSILMLFQAPIFLLSPGQNESPLSIGLAKKFVRVFGKMVWKKSERNFWPIQTFLQNFVFPFTWRC